MKLLPRKEIAVQIAKDRKAQIDEGVSLAKKVDALRLTLSNLQRQHQLFLEGMERELKAKTERLVEDISGKERRVAELEERMKKLMEPIDAVRKEADMKNIDADQRQMDITAQEASMADKQARIDEKLKKAAYTLSFIKIRERELVKVYERADQNGADTERIKKEAEEIKDKNIRYADAKEMELTEREKALAAYEFTLRTKEEHIDMAKKDIEDEKVRLADQRATLERALARNK